MSVVKGGGEKEEIVTMRVDSSQKENTLSFRTLVRTLPPSDLFYLLHVLLLSSRLILFPSPSAAALRSPHLPQARKPASRSDPLFLENKSRTAGWLSFRTAQGEVFNFFRFSFRTGDSISVVLTLFYVANV